MRRTRRGNTISIHASIRRRQSADDKKSALIAISIHASIRRRLCCPPRKISAHKISIHASIRRRRVTIPCGYHRVHFNPRLHTEATKNLTPCSLEPRISIHASIRRRHGIESGVPFFLYFNPRLHTEATHRRIHAHVGY